MLLIRVARILIEIIFCVPWKKESRTGFDIRVNKFKNVNIAVNHALYIIQNLYIAFIQ